jgi:hypothetical protein
MAEPDSSGGIELTTVTFELPEEEWSQLEQLAASRGDSRTLVLRKAISTEVFLDELSNACTAIVVEHPRTRLDRLLGLGPRLSELIFHR